MLKLLPYILIAVFATILGMIGTEDRKDAQADQTEYCQMVKQFKDTNGAYGWPDYENAYDEWCADQEVANVKH